MLTRNELIAKATRNNYDSIIASQHLNDWENSNATELSDVYGSYSAEKARAMKYCKEFCESVGGTDLRIISHNSNFFSIAFIIQVSKGNFLFVYHTYANTRACWI